jgi:hypothetical protein
MAAGGAGDILALTHRRPGHAVVLHLHSSKIGSFPRRRVRAQPGPTAGRMFPIDLRQRPEIAEALTPALAATSPMLRVASAICGSSLT